MGLRENGRAVGQVSGSPCNRRLPCRLLSRADCTDTFWYSEDAGSGGLYSVEESRMALF